MKTSDQLTDLFRDRGLRVTPQRQVIFRLLHGDDAHPTVESLYERAHAEMPTMSLKTVYQTVHDLEALGEVDVLDLGTGSLRVDPNVEQPHHHLVCRGCGRIRDLPVEFDGLRVPGRFRRDFTVDAVQVIFRGHCGNCS
jgi:Fe2+ or Zn2+ uptake regulation protein